MHDTFAFDWLVWRSGESLRRTNQSRASMSWIITVGPALLTAQHGRMVAELCELKKFVWNGRMNVAQ